MASGKRPEAVEKEQPERAEVYVYEAPWQVYGVTWSVQREHKFRLAIGSFIQEFQNKVEIVKLDEASGKFMSNPNFSFDHPYPATKIMFIPDKESQKPDLLATSADYLRILRIHEDKVELKSVLNKNKNSELCAPLTSFDWNEWEMKRLGTSSIDTTCTIWDVEREVVETQLNAHDEAVYDIAWGGREVFASVSDDGSVRVFDLRRKKHPIIMMYENPENTALLRLGWNKQDPPYMAATVMDSAKVIVLDIRSPNRPVAELQRHHSNVNAVAWDPHGSCHLCTAGDDSQALIWDLSTTTTSTVEGSLEPILAYKAEAGINQVQWSSTQPDSVAIAFAKKLQILRL